MSADSPRRSFFDTNVLIYSDDDSSPAKQAIALDLLEEHARAKTGVVSLQVLQEYYVAVIRKLKLDASIARRKIELFAAMDVVEPKLEDVLAAIDLHRLRKISYWDALVIRCARVSGCRAILSEDMQHGQGFDGVEIVNPFR